jgi:hypothetical protein
MRRDCPLVRVTSAVPQLGYSARPRRGDAVAGPGLEIAQRTKPWPRPARLVAVRAPDEGDRSAAPGAVIGDQL